MILRQWLTENKVFFETIASVLLGLMSIIVSLVALRLSSYQAQLTESQIALSKQQQLPIITLNEHLIFDDKSSSFTRKQLVISNIGPPLKEFSYEHAEFMKLTSQLSNHKFASVLVPLNGYYDTGVLTHEPVGKLATLSSSIAEGNHSKAVDVIWAFSSLIEEEKRQGYGDVMSYVAVRYKDIWGESHEDVYLASNGGARLSSAEGREIIEAKSEGFKKQNYVELQTVTPQILYQKWKALKKDL